MKTKNPYKGVTFTTASGDDITQLRLGDRREKAIAGDGTINASDRKDLMAQIGELVTAASTGQIKRVEDPQAKVDRRLHQEVLAAAWNEPNKTNPNSKWAKLGVEIAASIEQNSSREGFMRSFLVEEPINQGQRPECRMRYPNVVAVVASGPADVAPQLVRDKVFFPPEFYINGNIEVERRDIEQISADILDEKYTEGLQAIMVREDRLVKLAFDASVGNYNDMTYLAGGLTPATLSTLKQQVAGWNIPVGGCLMSFDYWNDITGNTDFMSLLDPVTKYDLVMNGELGTLLGMPLKTDGYRQPELQVLNQGEIYILGQPQNVGQYTTRGGVESTPIDGAILSKTTSGWFMSELLSLALPNGRAIAAGKRV